MKTHVEMVRDVIEKIGKSLQAEQTLKGTIGDLVRLIQLEKEMEKEEEPPHEIRVTWVNQPQESSIER